MDFLNQLADRFGLDIIYAFGSNAKKVADMLDKDAPGLNISKSSDVDIGVRPAFGKELTVREKVNLSMELEDLFSVNRVDLVVIPEADPFLAANIIRGERIYARDGYQADEYDLYILRRAGDLIPLERERISLIMKEKD
ncbi:MAG: hypothetical protein JW882_03255 [Deltaproteobacteria bacterium]|nr:hypothetical protein [Deltaproteobacteria bacterium]